MSNSDEAQILVSRSTLHHAISEYLVKRSPFEIKDFIIVFYVIVFFIWFCTLCLKILSSIRTYRNNMIGVYALHKATFQNNTEEALKLCKAYPEAINKIIDTEKFTPFLRACHHGNFTLVRYMLNNGADITSCTARRENAFYLAVHDRIVNKDSKDASCIHALYHAGVDINFPNINNFNALQLASMCGHTTLVKWLITKNAKFKVSPTPYALARTAGYKDTARYIREIINLKS